MTDKHIPASKMFELPQFSDPITGQAAIFHADLRALIDEAPEVESVAGYKLVPIEPTVDMLTAGSEHCMHANSPLGVYLAMLSAAPSPPPSPDLTKLVGELVEALGEAHWLVSSELPKHLDKDQLLNLDAFRNKLTLLLTRAKEYLK